nr:MAG TPA: hypothetical protein [Caudoviricetes sp.]
MGEEIWEQTAENFNVGKVGQVWFYGDDDLNLILKGHRIEAATLTYDSMLTFVMDDNLLVQFYAGCGLADANVRLDRVSHRSGEIMSVGTVSTVTDSGRRRTQLFAWTNDEYGSETLEVLFEAFEVSKSESRSADRGMFFGVAFRAPSASEHMIGADR